MYFDTHIHIVPGVDDGPTSVAEALEMADALVHMGWEAIVATPHVHPVLFDNEAEHLRGEIAKLQVVFEDEGVGLRLLPGAEHFLDPGVFERIINGRGLPLGGHGGVHLVEVPFNAPFPSLPEKLFRMRIKGITPVIAHPERCAVFADTRVARDAVRAGAILQLGLGSLAGEYGRQARSTALALLEASLYSLAATDLHGAGDARERLGEWLAALERAAGEERMNTLLASNPARLLAGEEIEQGGSP